MARFFDFATPSTPVKKDQEQRYRPDLSNANLEWILFRFR